MPAATSRYPITVTKDGVENRLDNLATWVETREGLVTGFSEHVGAPVEVAGRSGSMYLRGRHREEKPFVLTLLVDNTDADGQNASYEQFRKNMDKVNTLFDTTNGQITITEYIGGTYGTNNALSRTNHALNPDFKSTGGTVAVRTNLLPYGSVSNAAFISPARGTVDITSGTGATPGSVSFGVYTSSEATPNGGYLSHNYQYASVTGGKTYSASAWVRSPAALAGTWMIWLQWWDANKTYLSLDGRAYITVTAGKWTRLVTENVTAPANAAYCGLFIGPAPAVPVGTSFDFDSMILEESAVALPYFDGDTPNGTFDLNLKSSWSGTANASTSVAYGDTVPHWTNTPVNSRAWQAEDGNSVYVRNTSSATWGNGTAPFYSALPVPVTEGQAVSASLRVLSSVAAYITIQGYTGGAGSVSSVFTAPSAANGETTSLDNFVVPPGTNGVRLIVRVRQDAVPPGATLRLDQALIEFAPAVGSYFDGDYLGAGWDSPQGPSTIYTQGTRKAQVEVRGKVAPDYDPTFEYARVKVECVINDGVWSEAAQQNYVSASGTSVVGKALTISELVGGTAEIEDALIVVDGPINSPKITDLSNGSVLQLQTNVPAGQQWVINCATYESRMGTNIAQTPGSGTSQARYTFATGPLAPAMFPISPAATIRLDGTGAGTTTRIRVTANRKFH